MYARHSGELFECYLTLVIILPCEVGIVLPIYETGKRPLGIIDLSTVPQLGRVWPPKIVIFLHCKHSHLGLCAKTQCS